MPFSKLLQISNLHFISLAFFLPTMSRLLFLLPTWSVDLSLLLKENALLHLALPQHEIIMRRLSFSVNKFNIEP
jgi:hypothetical protein